MVHSTVHTAVHTAAHTAAHAAGSSTVRPVEALVVLGCRVRLDGAPTAALRRRIERAAELFRAGVAERVVMSGGRRWEGIMEAEAMRRHWLALGLADRSVWLERRSLTTRGNAHCCAELLRREGVTRVGLITCDFHLPRALRHFEAAGVAAAGFSAPAQRPPMTRLWLWARELGARLIEPLAPGSSAHWIPEPSEEEAPEDEPPAPREP